MTEVLVAREGRLGVLTLNRPQALNALNHAMVAAIAGQLDEWESDPTIDCVLFTGSGDRAFCAGGDVVSIYRDAVAGTAASLDFWRDEYRLNARIANYLKPIIAFMDGIVLGGGVGLACHASHRVVTETSSVGLPETTIGFVPDVGSTWLLSRSPGELGIHLALTAQPVDAAGAIVVGIADAFVPRDRLAELRELLASATPDDAIASVAVPPGESALAADRDWIDACYSFDDVSLILEALRSAGQGATAERILTKSPTAVTLALESLRRAHELPDLESALEQELRVSARCLRAPDFAEGIRAQVIDKDRAPRWMPARLEDVDRASIEEYFEPLDEGGLFDQGGTA